MSDAPRQWTRDELDRVYPLPDGWSWGHDRQTGWLARGPLDSSVSVDRESGDVVSVINRDTGWSDHFPPADVAMPVILASKGWDSLAAMAEHVDILAAESSRAEITAKRELAAQYHDGMRVAFKSIAAMLRRGAVDP